MKKLYLDRVSQLIQNKSARTQINAELESHILDKADYYTEIGYSQEVALQRATEEMGSPDDTAVPLNALHKGSAFKSIFTILSIVAVVAMFFLGNMHCDSFGYANNNLDYPHYVKYDFMSLAIFTGYVFLLYLSRKHKNKLITLLILDSFALQILFTVTTNTLFQENIFVSDVTTLFQPLTYALVMIATSGFSGYIDSIFSYSFIALPPVGTDIYRGIAILLFSVLVAWAVAVYVEISRQEKMKPTHIYKKPLEITAKITAVLLVLNLIVMTTGTVIAFSELDYKINETFTVRQNMIDCVLMADKKANYEEQLCYLAESGYKAEQNISFDLHDTADTPYVYLYNSNILKLINSSTNDCSYIINAGATTTSSIVENAVLCDNSDLAELSGFGYGTSIGDFMCSQVYAKAYEIQREFYDNSDFSDIPTYSDRIYFHYHFDESANNEIIFVVFEDGELTENTAIDNIIKIKQKRSEMINWIVGEATAVYDYKALNDRRDILGERVYELEEIGIKMKDTFEDGSMSHYENDDDYNRIILDKNRETGDYYFKYYSTEVEDVKIAANDKLYFTEEKFDIFEKGMDFYDFIKPENNYFYSNAACVVSKAKFDTEELEFSDRTIDFIYAVKDDSGAVVNKYVLEFKNGVLTDKRLDGLFSEVYNELYY